MDTSVHYPEPLLRLGSIIERIYRAKYPELIRKQTRPAPLSKLRDQLTKQYAITEQSIIHSCQESPLCRELFFVRKGHFPRRETVFILSLLCWLDFSGGSYSQIGFVSRMVGGAIEEDELAGMIKAREEIGHQIDAGSAITVTPDDALHMSARFKYLFSIGMKPYEIGVKSDELKQYSDQQKQRIAKHTSQKRPLRRLNGPWQTQKRFNWKPGEEQSWN